MSTLQLEVAFGQRRHENHALHWIILVYKQGSSRGTYYHVTGGPTQNDAYKVEIQDNKRVDSNGISERHPVCEIKESDRNRLKSAAWRVEPRFCQRWVVEVFRDLEGRNLVPQGTTLEWYNRMEVDPHSTDGAEASASAALPATAAEGNSTAAATQSGWVWDENHQRYRCWDEANQSWVWSE